MHLAGVTERVTAVASGAASLLEAYFCDSVIFRRPRIVLCSSKPLTAHASMHLACLARGLRMPHTSLRGGAAMARSVGSEACGFDEFLT